MESRSPVHIKTKQKQHLTILWVNNYVTIAVNLLIDLDIDFCFWAGGGSQKSVYLVLQITIFPLKNIYMGGTAGE